MTVPGLPWYPAFFAFPGAMAPPMPNMPTPLLTLAFDPRPMQAPSMAAAVRSALGGRAGDAGAADAVDRFASELAAKFWIYLARTQVSLVVGQGPTCCYAPWLLPVSPVVQGSAEGQGLTTGVFP